MKKNKLIEIYKEIVAKDSGSKTMEKQKLLHEYLANEILEVIDNEKYELRFADKNGTNSEFNYNGPLFDKKTDITILEKETGILKVAFPVKMIFSNYSQNAKNYYEQMVAEAINLKLNKVLVYNIIILNMNPPYFKEKREEIKHIESPKTSSYYKLYERFSAYNKGSISDGVLYALVDFGDKSILESYQKKEKFKWNNLSTDLSKIKEEDINIEYPFLNKMPNALTMKTLKEKIVIDLLKDSSDEEEIFSKNVIDYLCPVCSAKFKSELALREHKKCSLKPNEREALINNYLKSLKPK